MDFNTLLNNLTNGETVSVVDSSGVTVHTTIPPTRNHLMAARAIKNLLEVVGGLERSLVTLQRTLDETEARLDGFINSINSSQPPSPSSNTNEVG